MGHNNEEKVNGGVRLEVAILQALEHSPLLPRTPVLNPRLKEEAAQASEIQFNIKGADLGEDEIRLKTLLSPQEEAVVAPENETDGFQDLGDVDTVFGDDETVDDESAQKRANEEKRDLSRANSCDHQLQEDKEDSQDVDWAARRGEFAKESHWKLHLSLTYWFLVVLRSNAVPPLHEDSKPGLVKLQAAIDTQTIFNSCSIRPSKSSRTAFYCFLAGSAPVIPSVSKIKRIIY
ncbi:hypothetical protein FNYG_06078 [Fusarium nygamai]|uniref:Uncharacterized protein n=1 Tax=Gibberella nygamai TaxID=42673 RepID=A0A2K0WDX7_GIBNY|nr:hypothetical protein FNYG_06078 [Fusarium nygamai]